MTSRPRLDLSATSRPTIGLTWQETCASSERHGRVLSALSHRLGRLDDASEEAISFLAVLCNAAEDAYEETRHLSRLGDAEGA